MSVNKANIRHSKNFSYSNLNEQNSISNNNNSNSINNSNPKMIDIHEKYHVPFGGTSASHNSTPSNSIITNIKKALVSNSLVSYQSNVQKKNSINGKSSPKQLNLSGNEVKVINQPLQYFSQSQNQTATASKKMSRKESNGSMSEDGSAAAIQQQLFAKQLVQSTIKLQQQQQQDDQISGSDDLNNININIAPSSNELGQGLNYQSAVSSSSSNQISAKQPILQNNQPPQFKLYSQMYEQMKQNKQQVPNQRISGFNQSEDLSSKYSSINNINNGNNAGSSSNLSNTNISSNMSNQLNNPPNSQSTGNKSENQYQKIAQITKQFQKNQQKNSSYSPESKKSSSPMIQFNYQSVMAANQKNLKQVQQQNQHPSNASTSATATNDNMRSLQSQIHSKNQSMNSSLQLKKQSNEYLKPNQFTDTSINNQMNSSPSKAVSRPGVQKGVTSIGESKSTKHSQSNSKDHTQAFSHTQQNQFFPSSNYNSTSNIDVRTYSQTPSHTNHKQIQFGQQHNHLNNQVASNLTTSNSHSDLQSLNVNQLAQIPIEDTNVSSPLIKSLGSGKVNQHRKEPVKQGQNPQQAQQFHPFHRNTYSLSNIRMNQTQNPNQTQQSSQQLSSISQINQDNQGYLQQYSKEPTRNSSNQSSNNTNNNNNINQTLKRNQSTSKHTLNISVNNNNSSATANGAGVIGNNTYYLGGTTTNSGTNSTTNANTHMNLTYGGITNMSAANNTNISRQQVNSSHLKQNLKNTTASIKVSDMSLEQMKKIHIPSMGEQIKNFSGYASGAQSRSPTKKEGKQITDFENTNFVTGQTSKGDEDRKFMRKNNQLKDISTYWQKLIQLNNQNAVGSSNSLEKKKISQKQLAVQGKNVFENQNSHEQQECLTTRKLVAYQNGIKQLMEYDPSLKQIIDSILVFNNQYLQPIPNVVKESEQLRELNSNNLLEISELKKKVAASDSIIVKLKKDLTKCEQQLANFTTQTSMNQEQLIVLSGEKSPAKIQQNQQLLAENQNMQLIIQQQQIEIEQYKERENQIRELLIEFNKKGLIQIDVNGDALIRSVHHNPESEDNQSGNREEYRLCKKNLKELLKEQKGNNSINGDQLADDSRIDDSQESSFGFIGKITLQEIETQQELEKQQSESPANRRSPKKVDQNLKEKLKINMTQVQETQKLIQKQQAIQEQNEKDMLIQQQMLKQQEAALMAQQNQFKQQKGGKLKTQNITGQNQYIKSPQQMQQVPQQQLSQQQQHQLQQQHIQQQQQQQQFYNQQMQQQQQQQQQTQGHIQIQQNYPSSQLPSSQLSKIPSNQQNSSSNSRQSEEMFIRDLAHVDNSNINSQEMLHSDDQIHQQAKYQQQPQMISQQTMQQQQQQQIQQQQQQQQQQPQQQQQFLQQQQIQVQLQQPNNTNVGTPSGSAAGESFISSGNGVIMPKPNMKKLQLGNLHNSVSPPKQTIISQGNMSVGGINKPIITKIEIEDSSGMGFHDEFMSRLDEFSLSWRKAAEKERKPHTQF